MPHFESNKIHWKERIEHYEEELSIFVCLWIYRESGSRRSCERETGLKHLLFFVFYFLLYGYWRGASVDIAFESPLEPLLGLVLRDALLGAKTSTSVLPETDSATGTAEDNVEVKPEDTLSLIRI